MPEMLARIHNVLVEIVARRSNGKSKKEFLIDEGSGVGRGGTRSMTFSKRFNTYRKNCGVDDLVGDKRRSRVNFHSFRRYFITKADQAGHRREDIERVVGHKVQGMSLGLYSGGVTLEQLRRVVDDVKLPQGANLTEESLKAPLLRKRKAPKKRIASVA